MRLILTALLALAAALFAAPAALAGTYEVFSTNDISDPAPCTAVAPGAFRCETLRAAVFASDASPEDDAIFLHAGTYVLTAGSLTLNDTVLITGEGARTTVIQGNGSSRVLTIAGQVVGQLTNLTIAGGAAGTGNGGNILVGFGGSLMLILARVTGGSAGSGAGIANLGQTSITNSVIDGNVATTSGGGILNSGSPDGGGAILSITNSTIAGNTAPVAGGGIQSVGAGNSLSLIFSTVGRNTSGGGAVSLTGPGAQNANASFSIIASNTGANCAGTSFESSQSNLENGTSCGFGPTGDPLLPAALSDQGGPTNVLAIPANSPAVDFVPQCFIGIDQRGYIRNATLAPCDAGAYEQSGTSPGGEQPPPPVPPQPPTPTPTATPAPTATPVANQSVGAEEVKGTVLIKVNGKYVPFEAGLLKNGSEVDTRKGTVEIETAQGEKAKFFDGIFKISQAGGVTTLTLTEPLDCKKAKSAGAAAKKPKTRKLWGDGKGKFRTKGSYSAATVRGTKWLVQDTCTTTTTRVTQGLVQVEDFVKHKKTIVRKGAKPYVARKRR